MFFLQFLGSEESILEYQPDPPQGLTIVEAGNSSAEPVVGAVQTSALADLIRSRDFVIDFPRVFVLDSGSVVGAREMLFPTRLPERSQSSLSLRQARDWMSLMSNKLEEQQGLRRLRKDEMQQVLRGEIIGKPSQISTTQLLSLHSNFLVRGSRLATADRVQRMDATQPDASGVASVSPPCRPLA